MIRKIFFLLLLVLATTGFSIETYENKKVSCLDVKIERPDPDVNYDTHTILKKLKTKKGEKFSQSEFDDDLKLLSSEYDHIEPEIGLKDGDICITLKIWPRPVIQMIEWYGNQKFKTKKLQKELDIEPGTVFNRQEFNQKFNKVKEFYIKRGYYESELVYTTYPIEGTNRIEIEIDVNEGRSGRIKQIAFNGFTGSEESDLMSQMYTKKYNFLMSWMTGTGTLRDEALEQDRMTILTYLHNKGYADARVDISLEDDPKSDKVIVKINAHRGTLYRYGTITFEGNKLIDDKEIKKAFLVHTKEPFSPENLRQTALNIKEVYGKKGYIEADVEYETFLSENEPVFNVKYYISEGEQFKIGLVHILGNERTKNNVILRESLLVPGERFDSRRLQATQQRLENIGYFKNVNVYAVRSDLDTDDDNYRDVYIEVEETSTGNLSTFVGFSSSDQIFGGLELTERNFNIAGFSELFSKGPGALRGGGEYFHIRVSLGEKQTNYLISWMNPYVRDSLWRLGFELVRTTSKLQSSDYNVITDGFSVFTSYPITRYFTYGTKYRFRYSHTDAQDDKEALKAAVDQSGILSAVGSSFTFDSTDSAYKPHSGLRSGFEAEVAGLGGRYKFFKMNLVNTLYLPLWKKGVTKYRADLRFIEPFGKLKERVPVSEKYFLGGEMSVRGYKPFILGEHVDGEPIGGISSCLLSFEYNQELFKLMDAFVFFDAGSISSKKFHIAPLRMSVGGGLRLEIMQRTPIMLGWGYPINPERKSDKQKNGFFFSMQGQF